MRRQNKKQALYLMKISPPPSVIVNPNEAVIIERKLDKKLKEEDSKQFALLTDLENPTVIEKEGKLFFS